MRLFIGLGLSQPAREALWNAAAELNVQGMSVRRENYHITLAFLGERDERQAAAVKRIAAAAAAGSCAAAAVRAGVRFFRQAGKRAAVRGTRAVPAASHAGRAAAPDAFRGGGSV